MKLDSLEPSSLLLVLSQVFDFASINVQQSLEEIFDHVLRKIVDIMKAKAGNIRLYDKKTGELVLKASYGVSKEYRNSKAALEVGSSIAGLVYSSGRIYIAEDLSKDTLYGLPEYAIKEGICSLICVPISARGKKLGVFSIYFPVVRKFSGAEVEFFSVLVRFLASFMSNRLLEYEVRKGYLNLAKMLIVILEEKDTYTKGHSERVRDYALKIAKRLNLDKSDLHTLSEFSILHDIGKIIIDSKILNKLDKLTEEEWQVIKQHPLVGEKIIHPVSEFISSIPLVKYHHERTDGGGYPEGLAGEKIPMVARIIAVADSFDAMISQRAYRDALNMEQAKEELLKNAGEQFDVEVVNVMIRLIDSGEIKIQ